MSFLERRTGCVCESPGLCPRHQVLKTAHLQQLCRLHPEHFQAWELHCSQSQESASSDLASSTAITSAPLRHVPLSRKPWEGGSPVKPWQFRVQIVIPHLDTPELVKAALPLWRLQTVKPFICIVDTGSVTQNLDRLYELEDHDVEIHQLRLRGFRHPSASVAMALDVAAAVNQQEYQFHTHTDVFPRRRDLLESLVAVSSADQPVVGYEISPRDHVRGRIAKIWRGMVGHTCLMLHMPTIRRHGIQWHLEQSYERYELDRHPQGNTDTEVAFNLRLREAGITPVLVGHDENYTRQVTDDYDHFRSFSSSQMYSPTYHAMCSGWAESAKADAELRLAEWEQGALTTTQNELT